MAHNHSHTQESMSANDINRSFLIGIFLNILYVIVELWYGWKNDSTALISDAVHNIGDISGLILAFIAFKLQKIRAGKIFSYGFKKGSVLASFANSILLVFAIGGIAWEGIQRILAPQAINGLVVMFVASFGIAINFASALLFKKREKEDLNMKAAYWHLLADALVSLGVVISGVVIYFTNWFFMDGLTAIFIAGVILYGTWDLFKDSMIAVLDGVPASIDVEDIKKHISETEGVKNVHHVHIWALSTNEIAITCHILLENFENLPLIKQKIKDELNEHNITHSTLEFEITKENCEEINN